MKQIIANLIQRLRLPVPDVGGFCPHCGEHQSCSYGTLHFNCADCLKAVWVQYESIEAAFAGEFVTAGCQRFVRWCETHRAA